MGSITISDQLEKEIREIMKSMQKWSGSVLPVTMETTVKTILQWYYLAIGYPISHWSPAVKGGLEELLEMKYFIHNGKYPKDEEELKLFIKKLKSDEDRKN